MAEPHWLEVCYWVSQIALTLVAIGAACVAWTQVKAMHDARVAQLRVMNATLLMELDNRWDSAEMRAARKVYGATAIKVEATLSALGCPKDEPNMRARWTKVLKDYRENQKDDYSQLLMMLGFFETVGLMVKKEYIAEQDIVDLFAGPITNIGLRFGDHIAERSKEPGVPPGLYGNALQLYRNLTKATTA